VGEWTLGGNLERKGRLLGPFGPAGPNAGYLLLQVLILAFAMMRLRGTWLRAFIGLLIFGNLAMLVATGSRGGFLAMIFGALLFLAAFRRQLGGMRVLGIVTIGSAVFALAAALIVIYTPFNTLFERLLGTEFEGVVPDSRRGWFMIIERIPEKLMFGHGPRIVLENMSPRFLREVYIGYPHNLYLFLLYSLGMTGFVAWMTWFSTLILHWMRAARFELAQAGASQWPRLGVVLLLTFLFDSMKIEFLRFQVLDYQHYQFTLWAMTAAFAVHALQPHRQPAAAVAPASAYRPDPFAPAGAPVMVERGTPPLR
jgi:O-antigen ligase